MKQIWAAVGTIAFWLCWPLLYLYLHFTVRTRILVVAGEEVLVVKGWLSSGAWDLPGGGLHSREAPEQGALRELREETGFDTKNERPQFLFTKRTKTAQGLNFTMHAFVLPVGKPPNLKRQKLELVDMAWLPWRTLYGDPRVGSHVKDILATWFKV